VSERHLDQLELKIVHLVNYTLGTSYYIKSMKNGRVCIYVYHDLCHSKIDLSSFSLDQHIEALLIIFILYQYIECPLAILCFFK
jgi:hypothetical protein